MKTAFSSEINSFIHHHNYRLVIIFDDFRAKSMVVRLSPLM